ncbi:exodeoxyribonuclease V subunit gamma [Leptothrix discophora]|uniref:RecBCD enzyme subunit RecC n=1 Tax=Leptothrix discophora TaxID=89 RepID=A0ABT9G0D0_LEPDI|nr:exodeoxyribonuclease V subunit gamma [Leptothrix discophora]MDP4299658.1 exodeoxyribonuclease V subunit gamma [Leptothrix discophora]
MPRSDDAAPIAPGLLVLQGNRLEDLLAVLLDWLARTPLAPLEEEVLLVQSNGIAEWLKMRLAQARGICAATRVELPARFLWRSYRAMLGRDGAPARSPLDEGPMAWRLMRLLPGLLDDRRMAPLAQFLAGPVGLPDEGRTPDLARRLQLARHLADLIDQYQVYRADWLADWAEGLDQLRDAEGRARELPADQAWQPALWRALIDDVRARSGSAEGDPAQADARDVLASIRPAVHRRFVAALAEGCEPRRPLPRRVVLFGHSHLPGQTLDALAALASRSQVILAVPNPCRYHWADLIDGRELLRASHRRLPHRGGVDLGAISLADAHAQGHPLLAGWGRQGRDFLRLLDDFEERLGAHEADALRSQLPRVDVFDDAPGTTLLERVQARIRDAVPLPEHAALEAGAPLPADDRSLAFVRCHSALRELEVLHDQLLGRLAEAGGTLAPRDIVVMVPDIEATAPLVHAVFGAVPTGDPRHIPYEIADLRPRGRHPMLLALEWLLRITEQRCTASELRELMEVAPLARRFGLDDEDREVLARWLDGAGVRWGLDVEHRASLDLQACGEANTWAFGLRRMLLGYASGDLALDPPVAVAGSAPTGEDRGEGDAAPSVQPPGQPWHDIAPYPEVAGLAARAAGALDALVDTLRRWWRCAREPATPVDWVQRARLLLADVMSAHDDGERELVDALHEALARWLHDCEEAGFDQPVPLAVLREAWLSGVAEPGLRSRFLAGGVTVCTLMPMRAIPFQVVALLGMNEGDYPRRAPRADFDLMGLPGQRRPGDRARRDDDRMLMLEALLSARRHLIVSWVGRSVRDQSAQPPSVLVGQLRDYIAAGWGEARLAAITTEHPLQPFSRAYFEAVDDGPGRPPRLSTHALEWRAVHEHRLDEDLPAPIERGATTAAVPATLKVDQKRLLAFLRNPARDHLAERLGIRLEDLADAARLGCGDDEPMTLDGLQEQRMLSLLIEHASRPGAAAGDRAAGVDVPEGEGGGESGGEGIAAISPAEREALLDALHAGAADLQRQGLLPLAGLGQRWQRRFVDTSLPLLAAWRRELLALPRRLPPLALHQRCFQAAPAATVEFSDWLDGLREPAVAGVDPAAPADAANADGASVPVWLDRHASKLIQSATPKAVIPRPDKLMPAWLALIAAQAGGQPLRAVLIGRDARIEMDPPPRDIAEVALQGLLRFWAQARHTPLPLAMRAGLAGCRKAIEKAKLDGLPWDDEVWDAVVRTYDGNGSRLGLRAEREDPSLARLYPDAEALLADPVAFQLAAEALLMPLLRWSRDTTRVRIAALPRLQSADPDDADPADDEAEDADD